MKKDTIYIDVDDEITTITEKVQGAAASVVALVLPKRCTVLQSSVNMRILQRGAEAANKKIVLITSEAALLPIAGAAGMYVAKTLQSKPGIPSRIEDDADTVVEDEAPLDTNKSIGELSGTGTDDEEPIELAAAAAVANADGTQKKAKKAKPDKKLKVPNFESFRAKLILGIVIGVLLISGWVVAAVVLPKAHIVIKTENKSMSLETTVTAATAVKTPDTQNKILPLMTKTIDKVETAKAPATGSKDVGNKASGTVVLYNCSKDDKLSDTVRTVPAGTGISSSGLTFILQADVEVSPSGYTGNACKSDKPSKEVAVVAQSGGDNYNLSARTYAVAGFSTISAVDDTGMGGGTTKKVTIVSEDDCTNVKNQVSAVKADDYTKQLKDQLVAAGQVVVSDSFVATNAGVSCSPAIGAEASEITASATYKYSMSGVDEAGLDQILQAQATKELNDTSQAVLNSGAKEAKLTTAQKKSATELTVAVNTTAETGIKQDPAAIAQSVAGQKYGTTLDTLRSTPGVADVVVTYSPFWVRKTPSNVDKITIVFENAQPATTN